MKMMRKWKYSFMIFSGWVSNLLKILISRVSKIIFESIESVIVRFSSSVLNGIFTRSNRNHLKNARWEIFNSKVIKRVGKFIWKLVKVLKTLHTFALNQIDDKFDWIFSKVCLKWVRRKFQSLRFVKSFSEIFPSIFHTLHQKKLQSASPQRISRKVFAVFVTKEKNFNKSRCENISEENDRENENESFFLMRIIKLKVCAAVKHVFCASF